MCDSVHVGLLFVCAKKMMWHTPSPYDSLGLIKRAKELFPAPATHSNGLVSLNKSCSYPCSGQIRGEGDLRSDGS